MAGKGSYAAQRIAEIQRENEARLAATRDGAVARAKAEAAAERRRQNLASGHVYFMKSGNAVKIGFSTNLRDRQRSIQTGCSEPVKIVKIIRGTPASERTFHKRFAEYRLNGEWFDLRGRLAKYLETSMTAVELPEREPEHDFRL